MINLAPNNPYGLELRCPVMAAAGCLGYGTEYARVVDLSALGALVTTSISLRPRRGPILPRIVETTAGLLWAGGPNPGIEAALRRYAAAWLACRTPVILSIVGEGLADYEALGEMIEGVEGITGLEVNLPDDAGLARQIVRRLRAVSALPLLAKLPYLATGLPELATAVVAVGADAVVLPSARPGLTVLPDGRRLRGLLCGPAIRPLALQLLAEIAPGLEAPLIAGGGITSVEDVHAFLALGAAAVQIGSIALADPTLPGRIAAAWSAEQTPLDGKS